MKIYICYEIRNTPWGGGNQFLKGLARKWREMGICADSPEAADIVLFNSHQYFDNVLSLKNRYPEKKFVHRVDGPVSVYRGENDFIDRYIFQMNELIADGTVFQSNWSREACFSLGLSKPELSQTILNAPDEEIFYPDGKVSNERGAVINLVATSWSVNPSKGFDVYQWLDSQLDKTNYSFTFVGRCNEETRLSNNLGPMSSCELGGVLRYNDIYITASRDDPCSNSLLEAMHCGLPAIACNSGGHPEIVGDGGLFFSEKEEIPELIDKISGDLAGYRRGINLPSLGQIAESYADFCRLVLKHEAKPKPSRTQARELLKKIDQFQDHGHFRPFKKLKRRAKVWL